MDPPLTHHDDTYTSWKWKTFCVVLFLISLCILSSMLTRRAPPNFSRREWASLPALQRSLLLVLSSSYVQE